jgi:outer membrane immunogenic protein
MTTQNRSNQRINAALELKSRLLDGLLRERGVAGCNEITGVAGGRPAAREWWGAAMNKQFVACAVLTACMAVSAHAADLGIAVGGQKDARALTWNGFYVGFNVGGHIGADKLSSSSTPGPRLQPDTAAAFDAGVPATLNPTGVDGGLQTGYNWQFDHTVVGVEADANWLQGTGRNTFTYLARGVSVTDAANNHFLGTVRARLGWVMWERTLFYATGGFAGANVNFNDLNVGIAGFRASNNLSPYLSGWTAGAGIEYAFANGFSVRAEYLYADMGTTTNVIPIDPIANIAVTHKYTDNIVRVGLNVLIGN